MRVSNVGAPETEQKVRAGTLSRISAGEVSMLEIATKESEAGGVTSTTSSVQIHIKF